jgi:hypothetical protein
VSHEVTITMNYADYLAANRLRANSRWTVTASLRFILLVGAFYLAIFFLTSEYAAFSWTKLLADTITALVVAICAYAGLRLWLLWCIPRMTKKLFKQQPSARAPYQFSFDDDGMRAVGPFESSNLPWSHFHGWLENDRLFLLSKTSLTFFCLPKAQLGEENLSALKQCLSAAGITRGI